LVIGHSPADGEGFDPTAESQGKQGCDNKGEAKAEAFLQNLPPELAAVVSRWHMLPEPIRKAISALVNSQT
jgi:hypothetical protein